MGTHLRNANISVIVALKRLVAIAFADPLLLALLVALAALFARLTAFLGFHVYIISNGMTTNEYFKWKEVARTHAEDTKKYNDAAARNPPTHIISTGSLDDSVDVNFHPSSSNIILHNPGMMPSNTYNIGILANFKEVFFPRSLECRKRRNHLRMNRRS